MSDQEKTGWPPGMLQDDSRELTHWFSSRPDARREVRRACEQLYDTGSNQGRKYDEPMPIKSGMWFIRAYIGIALMILATWAGWAVIAIVRGGQ